MHRSATRALALVAFAGGVTALLFAVLSALGAPSTGVGRADAGATQQSRSVAFGHRRITVRVQTDGSSCFDVWDGAVKTHACVPGLGAAEIRYAVGRHAVGGIAGDDVTAVILKLTHRGTVWATLRRGAFYADVPASHRVRAVVKVLRGGSRETLPVRPSR